MAASVLVCRADEIRLFHPDNAGLPGLVPRHQAASIKAPIDLGPPRDRELTFVKVNDANKPAACFIDLIAGS